MDEFALTLQLIQEFHKQVSIAASFVCKKEANSYPDLTPTLALTLT